MKIPKTTAISVALAAAATALAPVAGAGMPSHDTYSWDMVTLQGSVDSVFDAGCGNAPGGTASYPFTLLRF